MSADTILTPEQQLQQINEAIRAVIVGGQEYWHEGRRVRRADLAVLYKRQQQLEAQLAEASGANTTVVVFEGR